MLSGLACVPKNECEAEGSFYIFVAVQSVVETVFLRASVDSLLLTTSNFSEFWYRANCQAKPMIWLVAMRRIIAKVSMFFLSAATPGTIFDEEFCNAGYPCGLCSRSENNCFI